MTTVCKMDDCAVLCKTVDYMTVVCLTVSKTDQHICVCKNYYGQEWRPHYRVQEGWPYFCAQEDDHIIFRKKNGHIIGFKYGDHIIVLKKYDHTIVFKKDDHITMEWFQKGC